MKKAAFDVFYNDPFVLTEGASLAHLMTYSLCAPRRQASSTVLCHSGENV